MQEGIESVGEFVISRGDTAEPRVRKFASKNTSFSLHYPSVYAGFRPHFRKCV